MDPLGSLIQHRYFRQHCSEFVDDDDDSVLCVKDLTILCGPNSQVSLDDILIVDNMIYSFAFNLENGIFINNYLGNKNDMELIHIMDYLNSIKDCDNLRIENEKFYKFNYIYNHIEDFIEYYNSCDSDEDHDEYYEEYEGKTEQDRSDKRLNEINEGLSCDDSSSKIG